jgi:hypothetical protein
MPAREIARRLESVARKWLAPGYLPREQAIEEMSATSGFAPAMVAWGLDAAFRELTAENLLQLAKEELGDCGPLDGSGAHPNGQALVRADGPSLTTYLLAGSIVTPGLWSLCFGLLVKSACLLKCSSHDQVFFARFAESLRQEDSKIGECVEAAYWSRNDVGLTDAAAEAADVVIAFGDDDSIRQIESKVRPPRRFVGHGHRVSLAVIGRVAFDVATARNLGRDVAFYDQQGCLSPHVVYLLGEREQCLRFCGLMAQAMADIDKEWPRRKLGVSEAAAIQEARASHELEQAAGSFARMWSSQGSTAWTVLYDESPGFEFSCLNRVLRAKRLPTKDLLPDALAPVRGRVQGIAVAPDSLAGEIAGLVSETGVSRICPPGQLQLPPLNWRAEGLPGPLPLLQRVQCEA